MDGGLWVLSCGYLLAGQHSRLFIAMSVEPFAYVVRHYFRHDRHYKLYNTHRAHPPFLAGFLLEVQKLATLLLYTICRNLSTNEGFFVKFKKALDKTRMRVYNNKQREISTLLGSQPHKIWAPRSRVRGALSFGLRIICLQVNAQGYSSPCLSNHLHM